MNRKIFQKLLIAGVVVVADDLMAAGNKYFFYIS